ARSPPASAPADPERRKWLERGSMWLDELGTERVAEYAQREQRFADATTVLAAPARKEQELKTRWDLVEALDRLEAALDAGVPEDQERGRMRAILVANETYRSDSILDQ